MQNEHPPTDRRALSPLKIVSYAGVAIGAIVLLSVLVLLFFPDPFVNRFVKPRITRAFAEAYPAYSIRIADMNCSILKNRFGCDSVALSAVDGTFSSSLSAFAVSGIDWMHLLWGGHLRPENFAGVLLDAHEIELEFPESHYVVRCERLRVSVPDSEIVADSVALHPSADDEEFFSVSAFRTTRFSVVTSQCSVMGLAFLELLEGKSYRTRSVRIQDLFLDVLVNKDKRNAKDTIVPPMPNEMLSSIEGTLQVDSLSIMNGRLKYGERFAVGAKPALITMDSMEVLAEGIANHGDPGAAVVVHAKGKFMKAGTMNVRMSFPVASPEFSFQFSGSMSRMELSALNSFLEIAEQMRIKEGVLQAATFDISVASGRARGKVRALYRDLTLASINRHTGSERGFSDAITSYIANNFKIRRTNLPDKSGSIKIGEVKYMRKRDDPFFRFEWFALRSGLKDVAGF